MPIRSTLADAARRAQTSLSRATIREIDDDHLCQQVKQADVYHSETPTDFESWHPIGLTSVAVKQKEDKSDQKQQKTPQSQGKKTDWNKNQPKGEAAETMMLYVNGQRSHPVGMNNDRRARPYGLKQGEVALYSADASGQTVYHRSRGDNKDGLYILTCDDQQGETTLLSEEHAKANGGQQQAKRFVSIRHVVKPKQRRKKEKKQQQGGGGGGGGGIGAFAGGSASGERQDTGELPDGSKSDYKHEGKEVNTEQQFTDQRINFIEGGGDIGYYDRKKDWMHHMPGDKKLSSRCDKDHTHIMSEKENCLWVSKKEKGVFASKPLIIKPDECDV